MSLSLRRGVIALFFCAGVAGCPDTPELPPPPPPPQNPSSVFQGQMQAMADAARAVGAAAAEGDLDTARVLWRELWNQAIKPRYLLGRLSPDGFERLYTPIGLRDIPEEGVHALEAALFGRDVDLERAAEIAAQVAADAALFARTPPLPVGEEIVFSGLIEAWRLPFEVLAGTETPLAGGSNDAVRALFVSTRSYLDVIPNLLAQNAALSDATDRLAAAVAANPLQDVSVLPEFLEATAAFGAAMADAALARGLEIPFSPEDNFSELFIDIEAEFPENFLGLPDGAVELGRLLFFDPILSKNEDRSCASCHKPDLAFGDARTKGLAADGGDLPRNSPTVINSALQHGSFWDSRVNDLADQALRPIIEPQELGFSPDEGFFPVLNRISQIEEYVTLFNEVFANGINAVNLSLAIAAYEATIVALDSPADRFLQGDLTALSAQEQRGLSLYLGKARCANCHYLPLFSGTQAPTFNRTDIRALGVPNSAGLLDEDVGLEGVTQNPKDRGAFKVPTLRQISETAPYMHNGVFATLEEVIEFYNAGGGPGLGLDVPNADPRMIPLGLTPEEREDLEAFLLTLTDTTTELLGAPEEVPSGLPVGGGD